MCHQSINHFKSILIIDENKNGYYLLVDNKIIDAMLIAKHR